MHEHQIIGKLCAVTMTERAGMYTLRLTLAQASSYGGGTITCLRSYGGGNSALAVEHLAHLQSMLGDMVRCQGAALCWLASGMHLVGCTKIRRIAEPTPAPAPARAAVAQRDAAWNTMLHRLTDVWGRQHGGGAA